MNTRNTTSSRRVLAARPLRLELDLATTAVIVVDMQNGFVSPGGSWALAGVDTTVIDELVPTIATVLDAARRVDLPIVYLTMPLPPSPSPEGMPPEAFDGTGTARWQHYVATNRTGRTAPSPTAAHPSPTWNNDIVDGLAAERDDRVVVKTTFGGFHLTELDPDLRAAGVRTLLFTGCTTSVCVETTLREASARGYRCVLLEDCVAEPVGANLPRTNHDATVLLTELVLGWVSDSAHVVAALTDAQGHDGDEIVDDEPHGNHQSTAAIA